ncbi:hypothetical protein [Pseudomonas sp. B21-010]|uniref:hypothetical protein n=1 Tax=Pseudomonas sp. B21-010 TaxID=2895471 RepID=UPI00215E964D|nr:hypothetical protein [Pseudomonas sp. B21-010]UVM59581.1 hypothetical protein LOY50_18680 [Pseudomonas sp. B21-010]
MPFPLMEQNALLALKGVGPAGLENAQKAAKAFNDGDPRFSGYMYAIENLTFMSHLVPEMS